jgi:hypothetical protein
MLLSMSSSSKKVLVIGGTRFSGLYLWKELYSRGHSVTLFNRGKSSFKKLPQESEEQFDARVKAVRVMYTAEPGRDYEKIPYMKLIGANVIGYPVKVGDPSEFSKPQLGEGKLSVDKNLPARKIETDYSIGQKPKPIINKVSVEGIKEYAEGVRVSAQVPLNAALVATIPIESFFSLNPASPSNSSTYNQSGPIDLTKPGPGIQIPNSRRGGNSNSWLEYIFS